MTNKRQSENELREQEAPLKNTDRAFVQVNKDGHPEMPRSGVNQDKQSNETTQSDHQKNNDEK